MDFKAFLQQNTVLLDGGTGTLLQSAGLPLGELPERWSVSHPQTLVDIHREYYDAGSNVVCTNTFGANTLKYTEAELETLIAAAVENARLAQTRSSGKQEKFIALDIGPTGKLLKPYGDLGFEEAVAIFAQTVRIGVQCGVDLVYIETMSDSLETKAAVLAVKENCGLPLLVSNAYGGDGKLMTGATPAAMAAMLEGLGVDALGANCSVGPKQLAPVVEELLARASLPVLVKPNAGLPKADGGYDIDEREFAKTVAGFVKRGARLVGGCCGTTPAYIRAVADEIRTLSPVRTQKKTFTCVSSYTHAVDFDMPVMIGERINPTGKKAFKQALLTGDTEYALREALAQQEKGAAVLDVNVGLPGINESETLKAYVEAIQAVTDLPLQIDTVDCKALEGALRVYNGKPLVNSVNGKKESLTSVLPLVKKYGGAVVALTLDENGIPETAEGRYEIAERIVNEAAKYGIGKKDILVDTLTTSVATDGNAANVTLQALRLVKERLGVKTVLGVSNVSFGLPQREDVTATFLTCALENGLSAAIANPLSLAVQKSFLSYLALKGWDRHCAEYIRFATDEKATGEEAETLCAAIEKGLKERAKALCEKALETQDPLDIVNKQIVPALDNVGKAYEEKRAYLPQLLTSAESAKAAFTCIQAHMQKQGGVGEKKGKFVIATVEGDIHDIGKNIVKTLLENYGFDVTDLGKDVPCERIVEAVVATGAQLAGLSALMTTTLPSMQKAVALLKEKAPWCKVVVGGAVLNEEYARIIGADKYCKDAMETVRFAEKICKKR